MTNVVRFPTEQCRLPGESREGFSNRQALEQYIRAQDEKLKKWDAPILEDLANGKTEA